MSKITKFNQFTQHFFTDAYVPVVQPVYQDAYSDPSYGVNVPNTLYSLGETPSLPNVQPVPAYYPPNVPDCEYPSQQPIAPSDYAPSGYAQQPLVPVAYAPYPNQPQYSSDPEVEALLQFTFNNYNDYQKTLATGQRPEEAPAPCEC